MSGPNVMMTLGQFSFELATAVFQELKRVTEYRWPKQERFGKAPVRQFVGLGDDSITLPGVIFPAWRGGRFQVDAMRAMAARGEPLFMVDGDGTVMGRWVIERIEETKSNFAAAGAPLKQEYSLSLCKFDDQEPEAAGQSDADVIAAAVSDAEKANQASDQAAGAAGSIGSALSDAATAISNIASEVSQSVQPAIDAVRRGMTVAANLKAAAVQAKSLTKQLGHIKSLSDAESALGGLMRVASSTSAAASGASRTIETVSGQLSAAGESATAIKTVQNAQITMNRLVVATTALRRQTDSIMNKFK